MAAEIERQQVLKNFIVLEGLDGAGTTTQLSRVSARFRAAGIPVCKTFEPTDGPVGTLIRRVLQKNERVLPETLAMLFAADREEHLFQVPGGILHALNEGTRVLCDRYLFSSLAYQSVTTGLEFVMGLNSRFPLPEIVIYLDTPVAVCLERRKNRASRELFEDLDFQARVAAAYEKVFTIYRRSAGGIVTVDGSLEPEKITDRIWTILASLPIV